MNSNNTNRNAKQQELVQRLEEIRNRRKQDAQPTPRHEMDIPKRNKGTQRRRNQTNRKRNEQRPQPQKTAPAQREPSRISQAKMSRKQPSSIKASKTKTQKKQRKKNSLIEQLSDSDRLADAMVLSEVLSKSIALRRNNR